MGHSEFCWPSRTVVTTLFRPVRYDVVRRSACQTVQVKIPQAGTLFRARYPSGDLGRSLCDGDAVFVRGRHEETERLGQKQHQTRFC